MALLPILEAPHPILSKKARDVKASEFGPALERLVSDMAETMYAAPGVGLAAPQIGDSRRIIVVDPGEDDERETGSTLYKMVNPVIVERGEDHIVWPETCLSVPELEVKMKRTERILVRWQDPADGQLLERWFEGFEAVVVQHEMDHLVGAVLLDQVSRFRRSRYLKQRKKQKAAEPA